MEGATHQETGDPWGRITVVIVTHNADSILPHALNALAQASRIIVVDVASADRTIEVAEAVHPKVESVKLTENRGYGTAANRGIALARTEYVLCLNPDMRLASGAIARLVATADENPTAAGIAPLLSNARGDVELDVMGPGEINHAKLSEPPEAAFCTWFITGAVVLWRRAALQAVSGFDESFFLYNEDADLCLRLIRAGYCLILDPTARAHDFGGGIRRATLAGRARRDWNRVWGHLMFERKHGAPGAADAIARNYVAACGREALIGLLTLRPRKFLTNRAKKAAAEGFLRGDKPWGRQ